MWPDEPEGRSASGRRRPARRPRAAAKYEDLGRVERSSAAPTTTSRAPSRRRAITVLGIFLALCLVAASALALYFHNRSDLSAAAPITPARYAVLFVIDGAGPDMLSLARTPNIDALARDGVVYKNAWVGQMETASPTSNATLATGVYPWRHGVVGLEWREPQHGGVTRPTAPDQVHVGSLDQILEARGVPAFASLLKSRVATARVLSVGGVGCAGASAAGGGTADVVLCPARQRGSWVTSSVVGHSLPASTDASLPPVPVATGPTFAPAVEGWRLGQQDDWVARQAVAAIRATHPRLTVINFPEIAALAPWAPPARRRSILQQLVHGLDADIGLVLNELRRDRMFPQTVFAVTSDGAVSPVVNRVPRGALDEAILAAGGETVYMEGDGAALIGLRDPLQAEPVAQVIQGQQISQVDAIYYKTQSSSSWSYQLQYRDPRVSQGAGRAMDYLLWTMASAASPDVVVVYAPHATTGDESLGRFRREGSTLGLTWDTQHIPLIIAGHGLLPGISSSFPARLVDVAPTLEALMGLPTDAANGVPLGTGIIQPPSGLATRDRKTARWLQPLVAALQQR